MILPATWACTGKIRRKINPPPFLMEFNLSVPVLCVGVDCSPLRMRHRISPEAVKAKEMALVAK